MTPTLSASTSLPEKYIKIGLVFLALMQIIWCLYLFSPLDKCVNQHITKFDYPLHYTNAINAKKYYKENLRSWGFNPFYAAGDIEMDPPSARILIPFFFFFPEGPPILFTNILVILLLILTPLIFFFAIKNFTSNASVHFFATALFMSFLAGSRLGREFIFIGHYGFLLSCTLGMLATAFLHRFFQNKSKLNLIGHIIAIAISVWVHILSVFLLIAILVPIYIYNKPKLRTLSTITLLQVTAIFLLNLLWIVPFIKYILLSFEHQSLAIYLQTTMEENLKNFSDPYIIALTVFFCLTPLCRFIRKNHRIITFPIAFLLLLSVFGTQLGLGDAQPARYLIPLSIIMTSLISFIPYLRPVFLILSIFFVFYSSSRPLHAGSNRIGCGFEDPCGTKLVQHLKKIKTRKYRIQIQDSKNLQYFHSRITAIVSNLKQPTLANHFPYPKKPSQFIDNTLFERPLEEMSPEILLKYIDSYNIGSFLVFSDSAKILLRSIPGTIESFRCKNISHFTIPLESPSYCQDCNADIDFDLDRIEVKNSSSHNTILKFHYNPYLKTDPPGLQISPHSLPHMSAKILSVDNGDVKSFTIYNE